MVMMMVVMMMMMMMMMNGGGPRQNSRRKTSWGEDEFFESFNNRMSIAIPIDIASSGSDDDDDNDDFEDSRMSFASCASVPSDMRLSTASMSEYSFWMAEPMSIKERRMRLLEGMGLSDNKELLRLTTVEFRHTDSSRSGSTEAPAPAVAVAVAEAEAETEAAIDTVSFAKNVPLQLSSMLPSSPTITRTRSDGPEIAAVAGIDAKHWREQLLGPPPHLALVRSLSAPSSLCDCRPYSLSVCRGMDGSIFPGDDALFCRIKNLNTGKEFVVKEFGEDGMWNQLSDIETGRLLTMTEFENCVGSSPIVKELMLRENVNGLMNFKAIPSPILKGIRASKKRGGRWLKNIKGVTAIKGVTNSMAGLIAEWEKLKDRENAMERAGQHPSSRRMRVHQHGKSCKELSGLYMCQEIQAHQGSIWTIKFSLDGLYLASAGEDRVIHVWEVLVSPTTEEGILSLIHPMTPDSPEQPPPAVRPPSEKKRKGKNSSTSKKSSAIPDNIVVPDTLFSLSETPVCSFQGHLNDVLDLSWSKSQHLLSSSMDKTVRLWDLETKACLKMFAHNDYVTCIQFNPIDERYFISGSLDAKVRIWSIPDRQVVDWNDLHEMVTAACYTPDGQGAVVGSHNGSCRWYNTSDCKLVQKGQVDIQTKKKKTNPKITGFQFSPGNPSEVLVTSADSQIRVFDGLHLVHKFKGFRNTSSQISASFTADGRRVVCASEDSQVYVWKRDDFCSLSGSRKSKGLVTTSSNEHFQCRDVSVAIPWPGGCGKYELPLLQSQSRRHNNHQLPKHPNSPEPTTDSNAPTAEDALASSNNNSKKSHYPPLLPKKSSSEQTCSSQEEELTIYSCSDSGISFSSSSSSSKSGLLSSISSSFASSVPSSWSWYDANSTSETQPVTAWGLVVVTADQGGEIKAYQNFGLPLRIHRQSSLF